MMNAQNLQLIYIATVTEVVESGVKLHFRGELSPRSKVYSVIGATPSVNDRVAVAAVSGTYVVLGGGTGGPGGGLDPDDFLPKSGGTITGDLTVNGLLKVGANDVWHQGNYPIEEGTWTPYIYGGTTAGSPSYADRNGYYMRFGNLCFISMMLVLTNKGGMTGTLRIDGLPFPASTVTQFAIIGGGIQAHTGSKVSGLLSRGNTYFSLQGDNSGFNATLANDNFSIWSMSGTYKIQT